MYVWVNMSRPSPVRRAWIVIAKGGFCLFSRFFCFFVCLFVYLFVWQGCRLFGYVTFFGLICWVGGDEERSERGFW